MIVIMCIMVVKDMNEFTNFSNSEVKEEFQKYKLKKKKT